MKIAIASDLHLEFAPLKLTNNENADVLILAGDICTAKHLVKYLDFFKDCAEQFKHVVYIAGNHEHYNYMFNDTLKDLKEGLAVWENIHVLDNETFEYDGKVFIGTTLWTDMNKGCAHTMLQAEAFMPDFRIVKYNDSVNYTKLTPLQSTKEHDKSVKYVQHVIENSKDKDVIVVSHHAPSKKSIHRRYAHETLMNGAFHSELDYMMELADNIKLWIHGHMHDEFNYNIGITNVVCNPRGYPKEGGHGAFKLKFMEV